jgi:NAD(P)-dependent dehydrogenase (short-subunit alcohol dehydrogenase family)
MTLKDKVAIITGSTYGIGRGCAVEFAKAGAKVVVNGTNESRGRETVKMVEEVGGEAVFVKADVSRAADVQTLIAKTVSTFGTLDILFNNAGIQPFKSLEETSEEEWDRVFSVNVKGYFLCAKFAIPEMVKAGKGVIINCGSVLSFHGLGGNTAYVAAKHAIIGLTRDMAVDLAKKNIRVVAICPGTTMSGIIERYLQQYPQTKLEDFGKLHLMGRIGTPEEIGKVAVFLASDDAGWIIGAPILVDGGYTVR